MFSGINMNRLVGGNKAAAGTNKKTNGAGKRKAEVSPRKGESSTMKRSALGDLTNAVKKNKEGGLTKDSKDLKAIVKTEAVKTVMTRSKSKSVVSQEEPLITLTNLKKVQADQKLSLQAIKSKTSTNATATLSEKAVEAEPQVSQVAQASKLPVIKTRASRSRASIAEKAEDEIPNNDVEEVGRVTRSRMSTRSSTASSSTKESEEEEEDSVLYKTAVSSPENSSTALLEVNVEDQNRKNEKISVQVKSKMPDGVIDFDAECGNDPFQVGIYAEDIFAYYKRREGRFFTKKYLDKQTELNRNMRCILVDWMVEVQESFELNHETMYLAVKIVDLFLSKVQVKREKLQLVGTTALYISAKYDERCPPVIDDFCYICDDAYPQKDVIRMEAKMLRALNFDIGAPLSYRFLRRYSRCAKLDMDTLTLARYILEMSLMEYDFIDVKDSMIAASALLLALVMKGVIFPWSKTLEYYSGYSKEDLFDLTHRLHAYLTNVPSHLKTIRSKYSHKVFFEAAKVPIPDELKL